MATAHLHHCASESAQLSHTGTERRSLAAFAHTLNTRFHAWRRRARGRRQLAELDCHTLRDIGVSCLQARDEWQKPFWRP